ncbi:MAG: sugar-binding protein [Acidobacteriota bacterium]|nr:MAG: sugar-binding protein [Acidobacteriota bacterium]
MRALFPTLLVLSFSISATPRANAQTGLDLMDVDLMFVGAHPDDDSGVMATFARYILDEGFKATVVTATGGDGGGNAIGPEAGRSLALVRKEEERRALALVGVDAPSFLGLTDFYFTLSAEETEKKWGSSFVCDVVRYVRLQRPEVIITMWPGPGTHGQHQMAARAATIAYAKAADPEFCSELITDENLPPFQPLKLYYSTGDGPTAVEIPTDDVSRSLNMRYADIRALGMAQYRSQGFDQFFKVPVPETRPERFMLVSSMVPVSSPETHLLEGALLPAGSSPPGVTLRIEPDAFDAGVGIPVDVSVTLENNTPTTLSEIALEIAPADGWSADAPLTLPATLAPGEQTTRVFTVTANASVELDKNVRIGATYTARLGHHRDVRGSNSGWMRASAPVRARFQTLYDIAGYRDFARETQTEWVIETLPARLPLYIGRTTAINVDVTNTSDQVSAGTLSFDVPAGVSVRDTVGFEVSPGATVSVPVEIHVDEAVLPEGRHSAKVPLRVRATVDESTSISIDTADIYALPTLDIPRVPSPPVIDGDLTDMENFARGSISPQDQWWRRAPEGASDASAEFYLAYDTSYLYVGVRVMDDVVVCNIAPDDIRAQLRSDAVGITVDPSGDSHDTSSVMQAAAFPCTSEGFGARGFRDADANQGLMEETAPGMEVASMRTDDGYTLEARIPFSAMPATPQPGDELGLNIIIYDGDTENARVGANISESGLGWAAFRWGGKQALPYLWPRVVLKP